VRPVGANGSIRFAGPPGWRRIPPVTRGTLLLAALGYLAVVFTGLPLKYLSAIPSAIVAGQVWRLVSYPLVVQGIINILFGLLLLWSFGSELEPHWGSKAYAWFLLVVTVMAGACGTAVALLIGSHGAFDPSFGGLSGVLIAVIVAWALLGPDLPTNFFGILPMTRKVFALIALIVVVFGELEQSHSLVRLVFCLGGLPAAWFWTRRRRTPFTRSSLPRIFRRRRFRVIRDDDSGRFH
jgi:membrane associated rhomboid family serine protease